ncbi:hypothetical protein [Albibacterium indicum]|uniref:hypothetical protein n=1 Tax=Albibacterium indicum TaxID=2292082 RepID=UPI000E4C06F2|nr:hypothetical protein [Pedobacter indicus]
MEIKNGKLILEDESTQDEKPKNSSKIYFFILAIVALLATNAYYAIRYKNLGKQVEVLNSEKNQLEIEIDRIEAELNRVTAENLELATSFKQEHDAARELITELRSQLDENPNISQDDLLRTQQEIRRLRLLVEQYSNDLEDLRAENHQLSIEKDDLQSSVNTITERVDELEQENTGLEEMVKSASVLKVSSMSITPQRINDGEQSDAETRARRTDKFRIHFAIANNSLAPTGEHTIYYRVTEPSGNLLTNGDLFKVNNEEIQYTQATIIDFQNDGKQYSIEWIPKEYKFQKGTYTVILYTTESVLGRASVILK